MTTFRKKIYQFILLSILAPLILLGCASNEETVDTTNPNFDHELYDGKATLGLNGDFPPASAAEAIARGDQAYRSKDTDLALYEYIRALNFPVQENIDQAYYKIGYIHQQRGNYELAQVAYNRAVIIKDDNIQYAAALGIIELKQGEQKNAEKQLLRAIRMDQQRFKNETWDPTKPDFVQQLKINQTSPLNAYIAYAVIKDLNARHTEAQALYQACLRINHKSRQALTNLGYSYYLSGDLRQAEVINRRATTIYQTDKRAWSNLGLVYIRSKRYSDALDALQNVMPVAEALNDIGYFTMLEGDYEAAVSYLERAINASPTYYAKAHHNLKQAKKRQIASPPVKLTNKWGNEQSQATVYSVGN